MCISLMNAHVSLLCTRKDCLCDIYKGVSKKCACLCNLCTSYILFVCTRYMTWECTVYECNAVCVHVPCVLCMRIMFWMCCPCASEGKSTQFHERLREWGHERFLGQKPMVVPGLGWGEEGWAGMVAVCEGGVGCGKWGSKGVVGVVRLLCLWDVWVLTTWSWMVCVVVLAVIVVSIMMVTINYLVCWG